MADARRRAEELGCAVVSPAAGAALRFLAAVVTARAVVEVGTGTGASGLWLLAGMPPDGVLTSVDREAEHLRQAREVFVSAGVPTTRTRLIPGRALDVLPRLADGCYDLVLCDGVAEETASYVEEAHRLLREGGVLAIHQALGGGRVADPAQRDGATVALRGVGQQLREDERFVPSLLPVGDGLLVAMRR